MKKLLVLLAVLITGSRVAATPKEQAATLVDLTVGLAYRDEDRIRDAISDANELGIAQPALLDFARVRLYMLEKDIMPSSSIERPQKEARLTAEHRENLKFYIMQAIHASSYQEADSAISGLREAVAPFPTAFALASENTLEE